MECCKLVETLSKCQLRLVNPPTDYSCSDKCPYFGNCIYNCKIVNEKLQSFKLGWTKYIVYNFPKLANTSNKNVKISSMIHLIHHTEPDVIICRIAKYSPKTKEIKVRYLIEQKNREQLCSDLKELYTVLHKTYNYDGRALTASDFKLEEN